MRVEKTITLGALLHILAVIIAFLGFLWSMATAKQQAFDKLEQNEKAMIDVRTIVQQHDFKMQDLSTRLSRIEGKLDFLSAYENGRRTKPHMKEDHE